MLSVSQPVNRERVVSACNLHVHASSVFAQSGPRHVQGRETAQAGFHALPTLPRACSQPRCPAPTLRISWRAQRACTCRRTPLLHRSVFRKACGSCSRRTNASIRSSSRRRDESAFAFAPHTQRSPPSPSLGLSVPPPLVHVVRRTPRAF
eukprot:6066231-Pleurochrysis_carterae.AAC.1